MGGRIEVWSQVEVGSRFWFQIPVKIGDPTLLEFKPKPLPAIGLLPDQPHYRLLVVDDQVSNRRFLVKLLTDLGFEVREACNGQEAIELWQVWQPHLIWMDMRMPVVDGYEATRQIKMQMQGQATAIIALTASVFDEEKSLVLSVGCDDFVRKPFQPEVIVDKLIQHLGVKFRYAEPTAIALPPAATIVSTDLPANALDFMPQNWLDQFYQAATQANQKVLLQLLTEIPEDYVHLSQVLQNLISNFRFDKIMSLTRGEYDPRAQP